MASRVLELLEPVLTELRGLKSAPVLVDATALATELGVSRRFVYEHAGELGARRLGAGKRSRLRFDTREARAALQRLDQRAPAQSAGPPRALRAAAPRLGTALIPIRGRAVE